MTRETITQMVALVLVSAGCRFDPAGSAATGGDGLDPVGEAADGGGSGALVLPGPGRYLYDTSSGLLTGERGEPIDHASEVADGARVVSADSVLLGPDAELRVGGELPLVVMSWSTIEIEGTVDASSSPAGDGAGANPDACGDLAEAPGGDAIALRGGCPGQEGTGDPAAAGGSGGGAVALRARALLAVSGRILVGGAGGEGGALSGGGGGGGSGGALWLEAHEILLADGAVLSANGGGGGEGGDGDDSGRAGEAARIDGRRAHGGAGDANEGGDGGEGAGDREASGKPGKEGGGEVGARGGSGGDGGRVWLSGLVEDAGARITPTE